MYTEQPVLIFLHMPKTAGTTIRRILERQYPTERIYKISGSHYQETSGKLLALPAERRRQFDVIMGHMTFGLHEHMPRPAHYMTLLREPVARVTSFYHHILRDPSHTHHQTVVSKGLDLKAFVESGISKIADNGQTRLLAGVPGQGAELEFGGCTPALLEAASRNIDEHFLLAGVTERFDEAVVYLRRALGWRFPYYQRAQVNQRRPARSHLPAATVDAILQRNQFDVALYEYVIDRFDVLLAQQGKGYRAELRLFVMMNSLYANYGPRLQTLPRRVLRRALSLTGDRKAE